MQIEHALRTHVQLNFRPLNTQPAASSFPPMGSLSAELRNRAPAARSGVASVNVQPRVATLFATASVDMWMRAVHSFLISASLSDVSDIWASVCGYYSSHYSVRAIAHLLGYFQLYAQKKIVQLQIVGGRHVCSYRSKNRFDREHRMYWRIVKQESLFASDQLFTENARARSVPADVNHRDRANYIDHLGQFPTFRPLDDAVLRGRVRRISGIEFSTPPIPDAERYPDVESVQIVAYHRLVRYRDLVDNILGGGNRFWSVYRNPTWAAEFMDYQLTEQATLRSQFT